MEDFAGRFREILVDRELSYSKFANLCGLSDACISMYCNGRRYPHKRGMQLIAKALGQRAFYYLVAGKK